jgi:ABC-type transport system substrate-binding protein
VDPESLIPDGIKKYFPEIAQNYWSRMTFSKNPPKYGGTLRTQTVGDGPNLDPNDPTGVNQSFLQLFFNRLVRADMSFASAFQGKQNFLKLLLTNDLAAKYEQPDPMTYTFQLNQGVKFHNVEPTNGHELTTDDVMFALDQYRQPTATNKVGILRDIDKVEASDKYNLKITMKRPAAYFLYSLAGPAILMFSRQAYEKQGGLQNSNPTGTGPFILDKHDFRSILQAHKNPDYFVKGRPYLDAVEFRWIPDSASAVAAFRSGQIDTFTSTDSWDVFEQIQKTEQGKTDVNVFQHNSNGQASFSTLVSRPPFNDVRIRRGLSMALDRDAMIKARFKVGRWAMGFPTDWSGKDYPPIPSDFGPYYAYNPNEAKKLLAEAGASDLSWTIQAETLGTGQTDDQVVLALEYWKQIGLRPQLKVVDRVTLNQTLLSNQFEGMAFGGSFNAGPDLDEFTFRAFHTGQPNNLYGVSDPEMDRLTEAQQREFDRAKREQLGAEIMKRELDQAYRIWAISSLGKDFKRPYVQNYVSHAVYFFANAWGSYQLADTWLDK